MNSTKFGGCGCSLGREVCDCGWQCGQGRGPTREQIKPLAFWDLTPRESLLYAIGVVVAIAGFVLFPWGAS